VLAVGARIFHAPARMIVWWTSLLIEKQIFYAIGIVFDLDPATCRTNGKTRAIAKVERLVSLSDLLYDAA
jgi:hypothetical protein